MLYGMSKQRYPQQELAVRLRNAMKEVGVSSSDLARECRVARQVVYEWRRTGRIGKHRLVDIARITHKPLEYFLMGLRAMLMAIALTAALPPQPAEAAILHNKDYQSVRLAKSLNSLYILRNRLREFVLCALSLFWIRFSPTV